MIVFVLGALAGWIVGLWTATGITIAVYQWQQHGGHDGMGNSSARCLLCVAHLLHSRACQGFARLAQAQHLDH